LSVLEIDTLILGGGVAGLSAQYFLNKIGKKSVVVERGSTIGGGCRVIDVGGYRYTVGPRKLRYRDSTKLVVDALLNDLGINPIEVKEEQSLIYYGGKYIRFPFQNNVIDLPFIDRYKCVRDYITRPKGKPDNFKEWAYITYGRYIAENFIIPHSEKSWKRRSSEITLKATSKISFPASSFFEGAVLGSEVKEEFIYFQGGVASLLKKMVSGGIFADRSIGRGCLDLATRSVGFNDGLVIKYKNLISTIPLPAFQHLIIDRIPDFISMFFELLDYNILATLCVFIPKNQYVGPQNVRMIYYPQRDLVFHRASFPNIDGVDSEEFIPIVFEITMERKYRRLIKNPVYLDTIKLSLMDDMDKIGLTRKSIREIQESNASVGILENFVTPGYILFDGNYQFATEQIKDYFTTVYGIYFLGRFAEWDNWEIDTTFQRAKELVNEF
jgi:protoporphyrinogen oxidase